MMQSHIRLLMLILTVGVSSAQPAVAGPRDANELAAQIDRRLENHWKAEKIQPVPRADDAEFLRRVYLDITGRIPRPADVHDFLSDNSADKRLRLIDQLLESPRFAVHFANVWRAELLPEIASNREAAAFQRGFESWLRERFRAGVGYDQLVRELLTVPIAAEGQDAEPVLRDPERPNPLAFFAVKAARPENLAAAVSRSLLGIRLECAQCHNHPFAQWKREQFWSQAAFFAGLRRQGDGLFAPLTEIVNQHEITASGSSKLLQAAFLDSNTPKWQKNRTSRAVLADWITSRDNPYFARATVNRMWGYFFGTGLVDPVDDFRDDNPPSDGALLDDLARSFVESGFDLPFLIRGICLSRAYQRTSARTDASQENARLPARMAVKSLTAEQFFDSLTLATGYREDQDKGAARRQFLTRFTLTGSTSEPETSVQQALTLLNGRFVSWATDPEKCPTLIAATQTPGMSLAQRIETLYLTTISRKPKAEELDPLERYVLQAKSNREAERLADVFWTLLNSAEFRMNH
ncbi:MAG TPA: DUF1549 and DUF1553 domain-containing protein [Gemmataceae bacterium]|jgi:hypothetical protein